jgi:hypothetical protein
MAWLVFLNVGLFAFITAASVLAGWLGWKLVGEDHADSEHGDGGSAAYAHHIRPLLPGDFPTRRAGPHDLARSA